jgi:hypothetical protein
LEAGVSFRGLLCKLSASFRWLDASRGHGLSPIPEASWSLPRVGGSTWRDRTTPSSPGPLSPGDPGAGGGPSRSGSSSHSRDRLCGCHHGSSWYSPPRAAPIPTSVRDLWLSPAGGSTGPGSFTVQRVAPVLHKGQRIAPVLHKGQRVTSSTSRRSGGVPERSAGSRSWRTAQGLKAPRAQCRASLRSQRHAMSCAVRQGHAMSCAVRQGLSKASGALRRARRRLWSTRGNSSGIE